MGQISFNKDDFGIKYLATVDMPLNRETKLNQEPPLEEYSGPFLKWTKKKLRNHRTRRTDVQDFKNLRSMKILWIQQIGDTKKI